MKKAILVIAIILSSLLLQSSVFAKGPINAGGKWGIAPHTWNAFNHALLLNMPLANPSLGAETIIWEKGKTIIVSEIPMATCTGTLNEYGECDGIWEGTHILLNWSRAWEAATNPYSSYYTGEWTKQAWSDYHFWLNGEKTTIVIDDRKSSVEEEITEFIFMRVQYVGPGLGNSNFDENKSFDVKICSYK